MMHALSGMPINEAAHIVRATFRRRGLEATVMVSDDGVMHIALKFPGKRKARHGAA
jgi:hypothetical protein